MHPSNDFMPFPKLILEGEGGTNNDGRELGIYKLDWSATEEAARSQFEARYTGKFVYGLPDRYREWSDKVRFTLTENYLKEIRRCLSKSVEEWGIYHPFDTMVRDSLKSIAYQYVDSAFMLLTDCMCVYKINEGLEYPDLIKHPLQSILLYRLYSGHTGSARGRSGILRWNYTDEMKDLQSSVTAHYALKEASYNRGRQNQKTAHYTF